MKLTGIHHVTAISADAPGNRRFYVETLGMRLVKKTVNQDDTSAYHLFYADGAGSPGTDLTFFDWPAPPARRGTHSIVRTSLRVSDEASLDWWRQRLTAAGVAVSPIRTINGRAAVDFEDPEGQRLNLQRVGGFQEGDDKSLQLWALPPAGGPRSLGVLGQDKLLTLTAAEQEVKQVPTLAISLEPKGGVPSEGGPTGPVLFKGALIQRML